MATGCLGCGAADKKRENSLRMNMNWDFLRTVSPVQTFPEGRHQDEVYRGDRPGGLLRMRRIYI